jgi:hypothetical protein
MAYHGRAAGGCGLESGLVVANAKASGCESLGRGPKGDQTKKDLPGEHELLCHCVLLLAALVCELHKKFETPKHVFQTFSSLNSEHIVTLQTGMQTGLSPAVPV